MRKYLVPERGNRLLSTLIRLTTSPKALSIDGPVIGRVMKLMKNLYLSVRMTKFKIIGELRLRQIALTNNHDLCRLKLIRHINKILIRNLAHKIFKTDYRTKSKTHNLWKKFRK